MVEWKLTRARWAYLKRAPFAPPLALAVALTACNALSRKPFTSPANGGPAWTEVKSDHFVISTDLDASAARRISADLEATFSALADLGFASADKPKMKVHVVYFRHEE